MSTPGPASLNRAMLELLEHLAETLDLPLMVTLWNGKQIPMGHDAAQQGFGLTIADPGVVASLLKHPKPENLLRHYATGNLRFSGGDLLTIWSTMRARMKKGAGRKIDKGLLLRRLWRFLLHPALKPSAIDETRFGEDERGDQRSIADNQDYIQFHYDVGNAFYKLFLDPEMQYSCAYFRDLENSLAQAQQDKLDIICRKLRLSEGERFLDIGCGWGGLVCHAARNYGVKAHGITLSQEQHDFTQEKIKRLGLQDRVTVEICDYQNLEGRYDKMASIGMFEHIGQDNFPIYFRKLGSLLTDRGLLLNHAIARRAKVGVTKKKRITAEKKLLLKYIFPGSELAPVGTTVDMMESHGFEVHDVDGWREHYAATCAHWCRNLHANRKEAIRQAGEARYHLWSAYLAGVSMGFTAGTMLIFQVLASKRGKLKGPSGLPPTREYMYSSTNIMQ